MMMGKWMDRWIDVWMEINDYPQIFIEKK